MCEKTFSQNEEKETEELCKECTHKKEPNYLQFWDQRLGSSSTFVSLITALNS
jgi:hypothetical protein